MGRARVVVIGGGFAGATAALWLARAGAQVTLLERAPHLGGRFATVARTAFTHLGQTWRFPVEHGLHAVWRQYRNARRVLAALGAADGLQPAGAQALVAARGARLDRYEIGARIRAAAGPSLLAFAQLPLQGRWLSSTLGAGPRTAARTLQQLLLTLAYDQAQDATRYDDVPASALLAHWAHPTSAMMHALAHSSGFGTLAQLSLASFLTTLELYAVRDKRDCGFSYLPDEPEACVFAQVDAQLVARGGAVRRATQAEGLWLDGGRVRGVDAVDEEGRRHRLNADGVVVAVEPSAWRRLAERPGFAALPADEVAPDSCPSVVVRLWLDRDPAADEEDSGLLSGLGADAYFWVHRHQPAFRAFAERTSGAALELHLYAERAEQALGVSDEALLRDMEVLARRLWARGSFAVLHGVVTRNPATHARFGPGVFSRLPAVHTALPAVVRCGDWLACPSPAMNLERAAYTATAAAGALARTLGLPGEVPAPLAPYPRSRTMAPAHRAARGLRRLGVLGEALLRPPA